MLQSMSYGKGDIVSYEYDVLERTKKIYYNNNNNNPALTYGYVINGTLGSPEGRSSNCRCACI